MDELIRLITPAEQRKRGAKAFAADRPRDSHGMNWNAMGLADWLQGYDTAERMDRIAKNQRNEQFSER